ncbi:nicotinate-nucleotide adenylyltransferase [bacterium]|nr:nicotinate-nucleotide adenylyltransferase [bacterium]
MKLCVFQGTFNPIHNAHLNVADYVRRNFGYDKILFIPAFKPPHKDFDEKFSPHRLEMVKLALEKYSNFDVSDIEFNRNGISYTYLTILELYKTYNIDGKIGFIIGTDAFIGLPEWYETDKLKHLVDFILFKRCNVVNKNSLALLSERGYKFNMADLDFLNISSTEIREKIQSGKSVTDLVPQKVMEYIEKNELYRK